MLVALRLVETLNGNAIMQLKEVWVVLTQLGEDSVEIHGIFSTQKLAEEFLATFHPPLEDLLDIWVEWFPVDDAA